MSADVQAATDERRGLYTGWIVGGLVILAVLAAGVIFWFIYHP